jgi:pseudouridine-5'-phosphate glycosidase
MGLYFLQYNIAKEKSAYECSSSPCFLCPISTNSSLASSVIEYVVLPARFKIMCQCAGENLKVELQSGILIGVPIPSQDAAMADAVESAIQSSLMETKYVAF